MWGPYIFHLERLLLQPLHSQNVLYGNAAQSSLTWKYKETHQSWEDGKSTGQRNVKNDYNIIQKSVNKNMLVSRH